MPSWRTTATRCSDQRGSRVRASKQISGVRFARWRIDSGQNRSDRVTGQLENVLTSQNGGVDDGNRTRVFSLGVKEWFSVMHAISRSLHLKSEANDHSRPRLLHGRVLRRLDGRLGLAKPALRSKVPRVRSLMVCT